MDDKTIEVVRMATNPLGINGDDPIPRGVEPEEVIARLHDMGYAVTTAERTFEGGVMSAVTFLRNNVNKGDLLAKQVLAAHGLTDGA